MAPENAARAAGRIKEKMLLKSKTNETISSSSVAHISVDKARGERSPSTPSDFVRCCAKKNCVTSGYELKISGGIPEYAGLVPATCNTAHSSSALVSSMKCLLAPPAACLAFNPLAYSTRKMAMRPSMSRKRSLIQRMSSSTSPAAATDESFAIAASRHGLDPSVNRFHAPIVYHENYSFDGWPEKHTFPMDKFARTAHALGTTCKATHPTESSLPRPLVRNTNTDFFRPLDFNDIPRHWLAKPTGPIDAEFLHNFLSGQLDYEHCRYIGFREQTSRPELIERTVLEVAGTVLTAQLAHQWGIASNVAGGTHHAHSEGGAGYTILNDLAVTANFLTDENLNGGSVKDIKKVLVIDLDVHQGDGTAKFGDLGNGRLSTLSIHCASNYPTPKATSTYDIGLPDKIRDEEYMQILEDSVEMAMGELDPDFVLYDAGVDVYEKDTLGRINISLEGIRKRDRYVLERCVSSGVPVAAVVGGGYDKDVDALARRHAIIHEECAYIWRKYRMWEQ